MTNDWIKWDGGECPVPCRNDIEVRFRSGAIMRLDISHREDWQHEENDPECDIIAYRLVSA